MIKKSFNLRIFIIGFVVLAVPLLFDTLLFFKHSYSESIKEAKEDLKTVADLRAFALSEIEPGKMTALDVVEALLEVTKKIETKSYDLLSEEFEHYIQPGMHIFALEGTGEQDFRVVASSVPQSRGKALIPLQKFKDIQKEERNSFVWNFDFGYGFAPYLIVTRKIPITTAESYLVVTANLTTFLNTILTKPLEKKDIEFAVLNIQGIAFAATDPQLEGNYFDPLTPQQKKEVAESGMLGAVSLPDEMIQIIQSSDPGYFEFIFNEQVQIGYRVLVPALKISVLSYASKEKYFGSAMQHFLVIYLLYGVILVLGVCITYWFSLWISRPLQRLSSVMKEVKKGHLEARFEESPLGYEINLLGTSFNHTLDSLLKHSQKVEDERVQSELAQKKIELGRQMKYALLLHEALHVPGAHVYGLFLFGKELGGAYYGYRIRTFKDEEDALIFAILDTHGKGIAASLYTLCVRSLLRAYYLMYKSFSDVFARVNDAVIEDMGNAGVYGAVFQGIYTPSTQTLTYYSSGHVPGIVRRATGELVYLVKEGIALGLKRSQTYTPNTLQLYSGDTLILYSDGLISAVNEKHQSFGQLRVAQYLQRHHWHTAEEAVKGIAEEIKAFVGSKVFEEEIVLLALQIE